MSSSKLPEDNVTSLISFRSVIRGVYKAVTWSRALSVALKAFFRTRVVRCGIFFSPASSDYDGGFERLIANTITSAMSGFGNNSGVKAHR
jgi:hypothetical protein